MARRRLPWMVFDYIDGTAGNGCGDARNRKALDDLCLRPRILRDVSQSARWMCRCLVVLQNAPLVFLQWGCAICLAPGADMMLARLAARYSVPLGISTVASTPMEALISEAEGNAWFQLYFSGDGEGSFKLVDRAKAAGFETLVLTVDVPIVGRRPRELRHGFTMPFRLGPSQFLDFALHPEWSLRTLFSGRPEMANFEMDGFEFDRKETRATGGLGYTRSACGTVGTAILSSKVLFDVEDASSPEDTAGVDAIQVSSHGARQLESAPAPITALAEIRAALGDNFTLLYDSGLRSGEDVLKAQASGANFTMLGRILQFAIAAAGEEGLHRLWEVLSEELSNSMAQVGRSDLSKDGLADIIAK